MPFSLPNLALKAARPKPQSDTLVRVVPAPAPKTFALEIEWEETVTEPIAVPVRIKPSANEPASFVARILRRTVPLELRLDPTL